MKRILSALCAALLVLSLAACGGKESPSSQPEREPSPAAEVIPEFSAEPESPSEPQAALDLLRTELWERGIADCRDMEAVPYDDDINGCVSDEEEIPAEDLLVFQFFEDRLSAPGKYIIAAVTKDRQKFFNMSMVDGVLYDIRESPYYLHEGEYRIEEAQRELEEFLAAETDIDPSRYQIRSEAKWVEEDTDRYYFTFYKKEMENQIWQDFAFYLSKDLKQIIRIDYEDGPVEQYRYMEMIELQPGDEKKELYTMEEAEALLEQWIKNVRPRDRIVKKEEVKKFKNTFFQFWTLLEDGTSNLYEIPSDLSYPYRFEVIETTGKVPRYTELRS